MKLVVETDVVYKVHEVKIYADTYHTGDTQSYSRWEIKRKQMASDIPIQNGGTMESVCAYGESLLIKQNREGVGSYGLFNTKPLADAYVEYLNSRSHEAK